MTDTDYKSIAVTGNDAFDFLQGQLSNDLRRLDERETLLSAWCNPKGRVICLARVTRAEHGYLLTLPEDLADSVARRLSMFRFRASVEFEIGPPALAAVVGPAVGEEPLRDWRLANLRAGIPEITADQSEQFTPHMLNLDLLDALSFDKGCYTGQEIVARTHYRGASKRRLLRFESGAPVSAGDAVFDGDRKVGDVVNAIGIELLAVVPLENKDQPLSAAGVSLTRKDLPYM